MGGFEMPARRALRMTHRGRKFGEAGVFPAARRQRVLSGMPCRAGTADMVNEKVLCGLEYGQAEAGKQLRRLEQRQAHDA